MTITGKVHRNRQPHSESLFLSKHIFWRRRNGIPRIGLIVRTYLGSAGDACGDGTEGRRHGGGCNLQWTSGDVAIALLVHERQTGVGPRSEGRVIQASDHVAVEMRVTGALGHDPAAVLDVAEKAKVCVAFGHRRAASRGRLGL